MLNFSMKILFDNLKFLNSKSEDKLRRNSLEVWVTLHESLLFQFNSVRVILHLAGWVKIKYLHLIRWEILSRPLQNRVPVLHWSWNRVGPAQNCSWFADRVGIKINDKVRSKLWTNIWTPVNCRSCLFWLHLTQKRCQTFRIVERKDKRVGGFAISATGF